MAFKPIYGYSGDHPVLNYAGTLPVCMNPYPYTPGELQVYTETECSVSGGMGLVKIVSLGTDSSGIGCAVWQPRLYNGVANLSLTLSASSFFSNAGTNYSAIASAYLGDAFNGGTLISSTPLGWDNVNHTWLTLSASFQVPYYRYRFYVVLTANPDFVNFNAVPSGEWVQLAIA